MSIKTSFILAAASLALGYGLGAWQRAGHHVTETPAPAVHHADGSITLARVVAPPPPPLPEPPGVVTRTRAVTLELAPIEKPSQIRLDLVTMQDGTQRVTAKGPALVSGMDIPIKIPTTVQKWTVGATWDGHEYGAVVIRSTGPYFVGIEAQKGRMAVLAGIRF